MTNSLIPAPKHFQVGLGQLLLPAQARIQVQDPGLDSALNAALRLFPAWTTAAGEKAAPLLSLSLQKASSRGGYDLEVSKAGIRVSGDTPEAVFHGLQTLRQWMLLNPGSRLPELTVKDWPDYSVRGVSYDVSRGRVPKLERLLEMVDLLAMLKVNQLQLYIEHTFLFASAPLIGQNVSALSAAEIIELDRACRERYIELVPSFASFGHMNRILELPPYRHLAEDFVEDRYQEPGFNRKSANLAWLPNGWTLAPEVPGSIELLSGLLDEYLPLFSSGKFNACCDEPFDLGRGQSWNAVHERGLLDVYVGHVKRLQAIASRHGKSLMIWGDVLKNHAETVQTLPRDITVLDWDYRPEGDFSRIRDFVEPGFLTYACPSVNGFGTLFPRLGGAASNISSFARAGREAGAVGLLNTEWGDGGHFNFLENSWHGLAFGAECGWNLQANAGEFTVRFCRLLLGSQDAALPKALLKLGDLAAWRRRDANEDYLTEAYFAAPGSAAFGSGAVSLNIGEDGRVLEKALSLDAKLAQRLGDDCAQVESTLNAAKRTASDPWGWLDYALFACAALQHGARKAAAGGAALSLAPEAGLLRERFETLWLARNRPSEIQITLRRIDACIQALGGRPSPALTGRS